MAVSYKDYVKKYGKSIEEEQEKERKLKSSKNSSTLSLPVAKENLDIAKNNLKTYLEDNGVVTGNNTYSAPNLFTIRTNALQDNITKNKLIPMNPLEMETRDKENMEKYKQISNTGEAGQLAKNIRLAANEVSKSKSKQEQLEAKERYENLSPLMKTIYEINAPIRGAASMIFKNGNIIQDERGTYTLPNYLESLNNEISNGANLPGRIINDVGYQAGKLAVSAGLNAIAPGAGTVTYSADMFDNSYDNALRDGYTHQQAAAYATTSTALEYLTQKMLGAGVGRFKGDSPFESWVGEKLKPIIKSSTVNKMLSTMTSEGTEEFVQEFLDQANRNITLGENEQIFTKERLLQAGYSALIGALSSGATQGSGIIMRNNIKSTADQLIYDIEREAKSNLSDDEKAYIYNRVVENATDNNGNIDTNAVKENFNSIEAKQQITSDIEETIKILEESKKETESKKQQKKLDNQIKELKEQLETIQNQIKENNTNNKNLVNQTFSEQIDSVINGTYPKENMLVVSESTPKILQNIGLNNYPITLTQRHLNTIMNANGNYKGANYHDLGIDLVKKLPSAIENPLNVLKSDTDANSIVVITDLADNKDRPIIASIKIDGKGVINNIEIDSNVLTSSYGRNNYDEFMKRNIAKGNLLYDIDEGIIKRTDGKLQLQPTSSSTTNNTTNLPKSKAVLPISNNMQKITNDTQIANSLKSSDSLEVKLPKNPTLESSYDPIAGNLATILDEAPRTEQQKDNRLKMLLATKILDKGYYVDKLARQYKNRELSAKYDYMLQSNGIANNIIGNGRYDNKGNKIGKSLYEIFEPAENAGLLKSFSEYLYNKHNIDRMSLEERYGEDNKPVFGKGLTAKDSKEIVDNYERLHPEFKEWAKEIYAYNKANMQMLVDNGVLSKNDMEYYQKKYPNYIPTMRANEAEQSIFKIDNGKILVGNPVKTAKGSNTDIIPLKEAMAIRTLQTVNSALRNDFGIELLKTIKNDAVLTSTSNTSIDDKVENIENNDIITPKSNGKNAKFSIFVDGARRTLDISEGIYEALTPRNVAKSKVLNKINNIRRALVTEYSPAFMITNPLKDIQDGSLNSKHPRRFAKSLPEAAMQIKTKGKLYQLYIANGGLQDTYFNYDNGLELPIKDQKTSKLDKINIPKKALNKVSSINEAIEMTPRLAEFIASLEAGDSLQTAMYNAQEITTNFKRGGDISKTIDANGVTFFNAGVQGALKQVRNIQDAKVNGLRGIASLAVKITALGLGSGLLNDLIWGDDDDYEDLSDYVKNNYYIIGKYGDGKYIRIPKGRVLSVIQKVFNEAIDGAKGKKVDFDQIIDLMENQVLPNSPDESSIISPIKNVKENKTWYGSDLVPKRLQDVPNAEQYDESTDSLSIWLGEKLNYSPHKINYLLDQYSGVIGDMILPYLTKEAEYETESILAPIIDKFTTNSHLKNQNISDFYSLSDELKKKSNGKDATDEDKLRYKYVNSINSEISELYKQKRETQNMNLPTKEKYDQIIAKQKEINKLAKSTLNDYDNVDISSKGNYGTVNNTSYYKSVDSNGESKWTKIGEKNKGLNYATKLNMNMDKFVDYVNTDFKSDKDKNGKTITNSRKNKVIRYLNNSNLSDIEKKIILKMEYSSVNDYDTEIINYVKSNVSNTEERKEILEYLGFKIRNGKVYSK